MRSEKLIKLCEEKSKNWDHSLYFRKHHSNGMCVKVLFELSSSICPIHKQVYEQIKNIIWSNYIFMVSGYGLIKEFEKYGMKQIKAPEAGAFIFLRKEKIIGHVGLCVSENKFWHMSKHGFVCERIECQDIAYIGVFNG